MSIEFVSLLVSVVSASVAISALIFAMRDPRPRIRGHINSALHTPLELPDSSVITAIMLHVTLTNSRKNPTEIVSYDLKIDRGSGWEPLTRLRDLWGFPTLTVGDRSIELGDDVLIYKPIRPIEYGDAQVGLLVFWHQSPDVAEDDIQAYQLTVTDIFGHRFAIEDARHATTPGGFDTVELLELAGAKVTRGNPSVGPNGKDNRTP